MQAYVVDNVQDEELLAELDEAAMMAGERFRAALAPRRGLLRLEHLALGVMMALDDGQPRTARRLAEELADAVDDAQRDLDAGD